MHHKEDLFACPPAMGKLVNIINTNYRLTLQLVTFSVIHCYSLLSSFRKSLAMDLPRHLNFGAKTRQDFQFVAQSLECGKSKFVACIYTNSKYCIQRTLLQNRLMITKKNQMKTLYASKEENEEMSKSQTNISMQMYLRHMITQM